MDDRLNVANCMDRLQIRIRLREGAACVPSGLVMEDDGLRELRRSDTANQHQYAAFGREIWVKRPGWLGRCEFFCKRVLRKLLGWYVRPQVAFNRSVARSISECLKNLETMHAQVKLLRAENEELRRRFADLGGEPSTAAA